MGSHVALALDAREAPPQPLKDIFKRYQKIPLAQIDDDCGIFDFDRRGLPGDVQACGEVKWTKLKDVFSRFMGEQYSIPEINQPIWGLEGLPGLFVLPSLLPDQVQKKMLDQLLHRHLSNPQHQTNLHMFWDVPYPEKGPDGLPESFFSYPPDGGPTFEPRTEVHKPLTVAKALNRSLRWCTLGGQYDWTEKVYPDEAPPAFPAEIKDLIESIFPDMKAEAAIVNLYSPGDTLSLHRDVSEESQKGLVSMSIGCDSLFVVGLDDDPTKSAVLRLRSGDAVFMSKQSRYAWHGVPKILPDSCPEFLQEWPGEDPKYASWRNWMSTKRVNLNVRQMYNNEA